MFECDLLGMNSRLFSVIAWESTTSSGVIKNQTIKLFSIS